jgi:prophage regulatory protein
MTEHSAAVASANITELEQTGLRKMLTEAEVLRIIPVSTVTLWRMVKRGTFPPPVFITANRKTWFADVIVAWQTEVNGRGSGRRSRKQAAQATRREREADSAA